MKHRVMFSYLCLLAGYSIFGVFAFSLRFHFEFPIEAYWLSFVLVSIPLFCEVVFWKSNSKLCLFYLLSFSLMINLQYTVVDISPLITSSDGVADYRLTEKIIRDSHWLPFEPSEWFFGSEYRFYPVTNFIYATISLTTGMPLLLVVRYLFIIKALVVPLLLVKWFGGFFDRRVAYLATMLFLSSPGAIVFPHKESFALIFFALALYISTRIMKNRAYMVIGLFSFFTLAMTHHFSTYVLMGIFSTLYLTNYIFKRQKTVRVPRHFFMLGWVFFMAWAWFIAWSIFSLHQNLLSKLFFETMLPGELAISELMSANAPYERAVISLGYGIVIVATGLGFLGYLRDKKSRSSGFLAITAFLFLLLVVGTFFRFTESRINILISHRAYEFGYILIGAMSAFFFIHLIPHVHVRRKLAQIFLVSALVLMMIVGPMAGSMHPRTLARLGKVVSLNGLSLNSWISEYNASDGYTAADRTVQLIISGYGNSKVIRASELFTGQIFGMPALATYVVTYSYMTDFYGTNLTEFDNSLYLHNLYANGPINFYGIANRTSP